MKFSPYQTMNEHLLSLKYPEQFISSKLCKLSILAWGMMVVVLVVMVVWKSQGLQNVDLIASKVTCLYTQHLPHTLHIKTLDRGRVVLGS